MTTIITPHGTLEVSENVIQCYSNSNPPMLVGEIYKPKGHHAFELEQIDKKATEFFFHHKVRTVIESRLDECRDMFNSLDKLYSVTASETYLSIIEDRVLVDFPEMRPVVRSVVRETILSLIAFNHYTDRDIQAKAEADEVVAEVKLWLWDRSNIVDYRDENAVVNEINDAMELVRDLISTKDFDDLIKKEILKTVNAIKHSVL